MDQSCTTLSKLTKKLNKTKFCMVFTFCGIWGNIIKSRMNPLLFEMSFYSIGLLFKVNK